MAPTEDLDHVSVLAWQSGDLGRYLYDPCMSLELPSLGIKRGTIDREDWIGHLRRGLLSCNQQLFEEFAFKTPLRCMVLAQSLEQFFAEKSEDDLLALISERRLESLRDLLVYVRRHIIKRAQDQIVASSLGDSSNKIPRQSLRLLLHLVPEDVITENFSGVTSLDLSHEMFCNKVLPKLSAFPNLSELKLTSSDVQEQDLVALTALPALSVLDLSATRIGNFGLEFLVDCRTLKILRLSNCLMDDGALHFLSQMKDRLECVTMSRQSVSEGTVHDLERILAKIVWLGKPDASLQLD